MISPIQALKQIKALRLEYCRQAGVIFPPQEHWWIPAKCQLPAHDDMWWAEYILCDTEAELAEVLRKKFLTAKNLKTAPMPKDFDALCAYHALSERGAHLSRRAILARENSLPSTVKEFATLFQKYGLTGQSISLWAPLTDGLKDKRRKRQERKPRMVRPFPPGGKVAAMWARFCHRVRTSVKSALSDCSYRRAQGRWAGGEHSISVSCNRPEKGHIYEIGCSGDSETVWSDNKKWSGKNSSWDIQVQPSWYSQVLNRDIATIDTGNGTCLVLDAKPSEVEGILEIQYAKQGKGFELNKATGFIDGNKQFFTSLRAAKAAQAKR